MTSTDPLVAALMEYFEGMDTQYFADPQLAELHGAAAAVAKSAFIGVDLTSSLSREQLLEIFRSLAPTGYLGSTVSKEYGGAGLRNEEYGAVLEGVAQIAPFLANHSPQRAIGAVGTEQVRKKWLEPLLNAEIIGTTAATEPQGGSQVADLRTVLEEDGEHFRLTGQKIWASHAMQADVGVVLAKGPGGQPIRAVVDLNHETVRREPIEMVGLKYVTFGVLEFVGTPVDKDDILMGQGVEAMKKAFAVARGLVGVQSSAIAQRAIHTAVKQLSRRQARGKPATSLDLIRHEIGKIASATEASRGLSYRALKALDEEHSGAAALASGAKAFATDSAVATCTKAIELCAAEGLVAGDELQRLRNDASMLAIADGTPIVNHTLWGRWVIDQSNLRRD